MANANQVILKGETILSLRSDTVTPETLQKGYTAHDKSGTKITGTLEASSFGGAKETWVIKSDATGEFATTQISFTSNGRKFTSIGANDSSGIAMVLYYDNYEAAGYDLGGGVYEFETEAYRKLTFDTPPTGALLTWLQSNATKQPDDTAIQDTKALTITSNGTVSVTPDAPYDALKKVDVTVDVASGGGSAGETTQLQVETIEANTGSALFCLWQTSNGWTGTGTFDSQTDFTLPNVIVGGYVIITREPTATSQFSTNIVTGVENIGVGAMNAEYDLPEAALVMKITAPSPKITLFLRS